MKARVSLTARKLCLLSLLGLVLLAGVALASDRLLIPEQTNLPFWHRGLGVSDSGIAVFVFYRPLGDVPSTFNLHNFFDFTIDPDVPLLVQGFLLLDEGAFAPKQVVLENAEGKQVVFCFVDWSELQPIWEQDPPAPFTIDDLLAMDSLRIGHADFYHEILHPFDPLDPSAPSMVEVVAKGVLEDDQPFFVATPNNPTIVRIGE